MRGALGWAPTRARLLPPDTTDFTGRLAELSVLTDPGSFPPHAAALFVITGAGGTGKTALAVRAARLVGDSFPDAHPYADLGGFTRPPPPPRRAPPPPPPPLGARAAPPPRRGPAGRGAAGRA